MTISRFFSTTLVAVSALGGTLGAPALRRSNGIEVTYQEPGICETTPGVKSYSGYVKLPHTSVQGYKQNMFFWFFEARENPETAPLTLWLQGGPGSPSIDQALSENGPCVVNPDGNSTTLNPWSWNKASHMLYIDSPVQAGFSYDSAVEGVVDNLSGDIYSGNTWTNPLNITAVEGIFASQDPAHTVNTTAIAAETIYEAINAWMNEFKQYRRDSINVFSQSYGGHYAPAVANLFHERSKNSSCGVKVNSVGIINGLIDFETMGPHYPYFPVNNTYGIEAYNQSVADAAWDAWSKKDGCRDLLQQCKAVMPDGYHNQLGTDENVTQTCGAALQYCAQNVFYVYDQSATREYFDITQQRPTSEGAPWVTGYLQQPWVLKALGAKVNYSFTANPTLAAFMATADFAFGGFMDDLAHMLDDGVTVALMHGDRDYRCNWVAGEAVSVAINSRDKDAFNAAGYAQMETNKDYIGGLVRQHDSLSFTRVFQAGHSIAFYQPETAYELFQRTINGLDIATGQTKVGSGSKYSTQGPMSVFDVKNEMPAQREQICFASAMIPTMCNAAQVEAILNGTAIYEGTWKVVSPGF